MKINLYLITNKKINYFVVAIIVYHLFCSQVLMNLMDRYTPQSHDHTLMLHTYKAFDNGGHIYLYHILFEIKTKYSYLYKTIVSF